jgi:hypothetical protein
MLAEYLEKAIQFETMAAQEKDAKLKTDLEKQAAAYRKWRKREPRNTASRCRRNRSDTPFPAALDCRGHWRGVRCEGQRRAEARLRLFRG